MGLSFLKQLQILILSTHTGPCQAQSFLKKHLKKNADSKKKHPSDNTCCSLATLSCPQTGLRDHRAWTTMVMPLLTNHLGKSGLSHTSASERKLPAIGATIYLPPLCWERDRGDSSPISSRRSFIYLGSLGPGQPRD